MSESFANSNTRGRKAPKAPELGVGDEIGAGDSHLVADILPTDLADVAFDRMKEEVGWKTMYHRGGEVPRLVAVEGDIAEDGSFPIYRHPADESPPLSQFSPTVARIRDHVQKVLKHPVNHVLIQHYRSGADYISEHSDKTIDVVRGSNIVNVSLGAQRVMTLRLKKDHKLKHSAEGPTSPPNSSPSPQEHTPRTAQKIPLPRNSMFVMGPETNKQWLHGINHDNRPLSLKSAGETYEGGNRISLTFRHIGTFLVPDANDPTQMRIYGQGAKGKTRAEAGLVLGSEDEKHEEEVKRMLWAFGEENQRSDFDWDATYGEGFDVLHFSPKKESNS